ncbi:MAG TPA: hypothetical protein VM290_06125, partial [Gaiellaceae bacterium]|nr:hypothetical protein [Gaiellaceae bacterium]
MRGFAATLGSAVALLLAAPAGASTNVLPNGSFEGSLSGWTTTGATLSRAAGGPDGAYFARVRYSSGSSFSILPKPRPVSSTAAGATYLAGAWVRSDRGGTRVCLRMREWSGSTLVGSAETCFAVSTSWQRFPSLSYTARGSRELDVYAYVWKPVTGDGFDLDGVTLGTQAATEPAPPPPPPPPPP